MKEERLEVRRRHGPTPLERLRWHVGTIVAALLGVLLVLQIFGVVGAPSRHAADAVGDLRAATSRVTEEVRKRAFPLDERVKEVEERVSELVTTFKHHDSRVQSPPGLTYPAGYLATLRPGESNEIRFEPPIDLVATAEAGGVDLKWAEASTNNVKVGSFEILRREGGGEPAVLDRVEGAVHAYRDTSAKPGHVYEYAVRAVAADTDLANTPRGRSAPSGPASAKAVADFRVEIVACSDSLARFKVSKWVDGAWRDRTFEVREGEAIGAMDEALGIDFGTGRKLAKLVIETSQVPVTRHEIVFDAAGKVVLEGGAPRRVEVSGLETQRKVRAEITGGALPDEVLELGDPAAGP